MNDLPVPEGDWTEANQKKQAKYNITLGASFLFFVGTLSYVSATLWAFAALSVIKPIFCCCFQMKQSGIVNFNFYAPKTYE